MYYYWYYYFILSSTNLFRSCLHHGVFCLHTFLHNIRLNESHVAIKCRIRFSHNECAIRGNALYLGNSKELYFNSRGTILSLNIYNWIPLAEKRFLFSRNSRCCALNSRDTTSFLNLLKIKIVFRKIQLANDIKSHHLHVFKDRILNSSSSRFSTVRH